MYPPLSQSKHEMLACPESYTAQVIEGEQTADSLYSDRGNEIHDVMARYVMGCTQHEVTANWAYFDKLAEAVGPDAGLILDGMRDNYVVDYEHVFECELWLCLDESFHALLCSGAEGYSRPQKAAWGIERGVCYEGTLDVLTFNTEASAKIEDYKSHWRPFDADTFQSKFYPFLVFQSFPSVEEVEFELIFTRFKNARRSVKYTRDDLPRLAAEVERSRKRQIAVHKQAEEHRELVKALPGSHCLYCPKLRGLTCPLGTMNPYDAGLTLEDRLRQVVFFNQARSYHLDIIKAHVEQFNTPVEFEDGNGQKQVAGYHATEGGYFPLVETLKRLTDWCGASDDGDPVLFNGLRVGSTQLKAKLKAKKRAILDLELKENIMVKESKIKFAIKSPDGQVDDGRPDVEEW